jgi:alkylated DNA repair dioxygenase AlkB
MQESLLDVACEPVLGSLAGAVRRMPLTRGAWVDLRPGWLAGSAAVFARLAETVPWRAERRQMYDRVVDVPRLLCFYGEDEPLPDPVLSSALDALNAHYGAELGEPFRTAGLCLYRDGRDSVAWHGDRTGRGAREDTMVAILSLGASRAFGLRPQGGGGASRAGSGGASRAGSGGASRAGSGGASRAGSGGASRAGGGGASRRYEIGHGDLLVMGGSCQRTWEHAVPKTAQPVGPRISVQFRPRDVR